MAIFVEGATEQSFLVQFVRAVAGQHRVEIVELKASGGCSGPRRLARLTAQSTDTGKPYYVQILDCGTDNRVKSDVRDQYQSLVQQGFSSIIGVRDVYPDFARDEIARLRKGLKFGIKTVPVSPMFVLGVMEIESWFLGETSHFERLDSRLTRAAVTAAAGFDPWVVHPEHRDQPANDLAKAYQPAGLGYSKKKRQVQRTVAALDLAALYMNLRSIPDLLTLTNELDRFFGDGPNEAAA